MDNEKLCRSRFRAYGEIYPCQLNQKHKGNHKFSVHWNDKQALLSGGLDSMGMTKDREFYCNSCEIIHEKGKCKK